MSAPTDCPPLTSMRPYSANGSSTTRPSAAKALFTTPLARSLVSHAATTPRRVNGSATARNPRAPVCPSTSVSPALLIAFGFAANGASAIRGRSIRLTVLSDACTPGAASKKTKGEPGSVRTVRRIPSAGAAHSANGLFSPARKNRHPPSSRRSIRHACAEAAAASNNPSIIRFSMTSPAPRQTTYTLQFSLYTFPTA